MIRANTPAPEAKATADFETRSACDLRACGAWKYSLDPSTEVLCLVYRLPYWPDGRTALWTPAFPGANLGENFDEESLLELCDWIESGGLIEAHGAFFERAIWTNILRPRFGFPAVSPEQWRCSAAKAAAHALPRKLGEAGRALKLSIIKNDGDSGHKLMMKMNKPRKPRKKEREAWLAQGKRLEDMPYLWWETSEQLQALWLYCAQDVLAEEALSEALDDLSPNETANYLLDQSINQRGFKVDIEAVQMALMLIEQESDILNGELGRLTEGQVTRATQRDRMKAWLKSQDVHLFDTKGATIDALIKEDDANRLAGPDELPPWVATLPAAARRAVEILRTLGRSSTAKYETMLDWACRDGRVRGGLLYHGASTGRWSGAGVQPHNFPKGTIKGFDMEEAWELIKTGNRDAIAARWGRSVMEVLACALRGAIIATKGCELFVADYAGIEVRVLWWVAEDKVGLALLSTPGADPYCSLASDIVGRPITKADGERQLGKAGILGCGYGMGAAKFIGTAKDMFGLTVSEDESQNVVDTYRKKFWRTKKFWYETEDAACEAVLHPGRVIKQGRWLKWQRIVDEKRETDFLFCTLPNGRRLAYPFPELREKMTPWGEMKWALTFKAVSAYTRKWTREHTYGGKLVENIVQAVSRDLMAEALQACEAEGVYTPILSVHDEVIAEVRVGRGDVHEFESVLTRVPKWASGCPIGAEGWKGTRYRK